MRWRGPVFCALSVMMAAAGCRHIKFSFGGDDDEAERRSLERQRAEIRQVLDRNAPVGSPWASHPDTAQFVDEMKRIDGRIAELK